MAIFREEAPVYWPFERGGTILLCKFGRRLVEFFLLKSKTMLEVGWSFILWSNVYLERWWSKSSYVIGVTYADQVYFI